MSATASATSFATASASDQQRPDRASVEAGLADWLQEQGAIEPQALERATRLRRQSGERLELVLSRLGIVPDEVIARGLSALLNLPVIAAADYPVEPVLPDMLPPRFLRDSRVLPIASDAKCSMIALVDPLDDAVLTALRLKLGHPITLGIALPSELDAALDRLYPPIHAAVPEVGSYASVDTETDLGRLRDQANEAPVIQRLNQLLRQAAEARASDIHIEPEADRLRVRLRVDGALRQVDAPPRALHAALLSRIKIMAGLNIAERRLPQDGRFTVAVGGRDIDLRVATSPGINGETAVLRLLSKDAQPPDFAALGFADETIAHLTSLLTRSHGIILATGPTGSGKTTSLYAALRSLNAETRKIITVEDPVEYQISGVSQIQVQPAIGLDFASALRSILRQDPDVIMIGEIRDVETARIAVQAALTGHLVLASLHTNDAASSIARLLDMGIEDYLLASTLAGVLAQRLVRRLCDACKVPAGPDVRAVLGKASNGACEAIGCPSCHGSGYRGRIAVSELLLLNAALRKRIKTGSDADTLAAVARTAGMIPLRDSGLALVRAGTASLEDVLAATLANESGDG